MATSLFVKMCSATRKGKYEEIKLIKDKLTQKNLAEAPAAYFLDDFVLFTDDVVLL